MINLINDASSPLFFCTAELDYLDGGIRNQAYIRSDIERRNALWPIRINNLAGSIGVVENTPGREYSAHYVLNYYNENKEGTEWDRGKIATDLHIIFIRVVGDDGVPRINSIRQKIIEREKGAIPIEGERQNARALGNIRDAKRIPGNTIASLSGTWAGTVHPLQSASGRPGTFKVRLDVNEASHSARMWIDSDNRYILLSVESQNVDQLQLRGRLPGSVGRATQTVTMRILGSNVADATFRTDADNGGWSVMQGTLSKQ